jgi:hypothetical protein
LGEITLIEFFHDSCIIIGHCKVGILKSNKIDKKCNRFLERYKGPPYKHNISKVFSRNLRTAKRKFRRKGAGDESLKLFTGYIKQILREYNMVERDYSNDPRFIEYYQHFIDMLSPVLNGNETDANIVVDAIYWSLDKTRTSPTLVSTDDKDIIKKKPNILEEAELTLRVDEIPLEISHVDEFLPN